MAALHLFPIYLEARPLSFRWHQARLYRRSRREDFIPMRKLPGCPECAGSMNQGWYPVRLRTSMHFIAARSSGTCTGSLFREFSRLAENRGAATSSRVTDKPEVIRVKGPLSEIATVSVHLPGVVS